MKRLIAAFALLCLCPGLAPAQTLRIANFRPAYGIHGPTRVETKNPKLVQGDLLYADFAIEGLTVDGKGKVRYDTKLELFDGKKSLLERNTPNEAVPQLGGERMPGDLYINIGDAFPPGKYTVRLTVTDKVANTKPSAISIEYPIEVVPATLAFVQVEALAAVLPGEPAGVRCLVAGFTPDKTKAPNLDVTIRVLDSNGKAVSTAVQTSFPRDLPKGIDPPQFLPVVYPLTPNRPGQFVIEMVAVDKNASNRMIELRLPLQVLDLGALTSGK
jgi:hypothetical protein